MFLYYGHQNHNYENSHTLLVLLQCHLAYHFSMIVQDQHTN